MSLTKEEAMVLVATAVLSDEDLTIKVVVAALVAHEELHNYMMGRDADLKVADKLLADALHGA